MLLFELIFMIGHELKDIFPDRCKTIDELALFLSNRSDAQPNFSLLLGAGASVTSGIHTGRDLVRKWIKDYYHKYSKDSPHNYSEEEAKRWLTKNCSDWYNPNKEYSSIFEKRFNTASQRRIFIEGQVKDAKPSIGYAYLAQLVNEKYLNTIFTTNFDDLINESLYRFGRTRPIVCAHDSSVEGILVTSPRPKIIKLHGDYLFDDLKCTPDDTEKLGKNMKEKFTQFLREYGLIIMGYSGEDESIMQVISSLLDDSSYMRNGLYWCIKKSSYVSENLIELLKKDRAYIVFVDGFDGALANINKEISPTKTPFPDFSKVSNESSIIKHWLNHKNRYVNENHIIKEHLNHLEASHHKSELAEAIADLHSDRQNSKENIEQFDDQQVTSLVQLRKTYNQRNYQEAIDFALGLLRNNEDTDFQETVLLSIYKSWRELGDNKKAKNICYQLQKLDSAAPSHILREFSVEESPTKKKKLIEKALEKDEYYWATHYKFANHLYECLRYRTAPMDQENTAEIISLLKTSIEIRPCYSNPSWNLIINVFVDCEKFCDFDSEAKTTIKNLRKQDPYSPKVIRSIYKYCKAKNNPDAFEGSIFDIIDSASSQYFPHHSPDLLSVSIDSAIEFNNHDFGHKKLNEIENHAKTNNDLLKNTSFIIAKSDFLLDIHQDIDEALTCLEDSAELNSSTVITEKLIQLYIFRENFDTAMEVFRKHEKELSREVRATTESKIYEHTGEYKKALSALESIQDCNYYDQKYASGKSYIYLLQGEYEKAERFSSNILNKYEWNIDVFDNLIVNYEYACSKREKPHKKRLSKLIDHSKSEHVKAMAHLMLGNHDKCLEIMIKNIRTKYSWYYEYRKWPVAAEIIPRLTRELSISIPSLKAV